MNSANEIPYRCPECGALWTDGRDCQGVFDSFLVLDYTDPGYGQVHFLTVACFMIQHRRYSDEALEWIQPKLRSFLEGKQTQFEIRDEASPEVDSGRRGWKVTRSPSDPPSPIVNWSLTLADVAAHAVDAASYQEWIRRWAAVTLKEMTALRQKP